MLLALKQDLQKKISTLMDALKTQISELNEKVDQLHQLVERIGYQVNALTAERRQQSKLDAYSMPAVFAKSSSSYEQDDCLITHKDILVDDSSSKNSISATKEQDLSPDIQIRRLTAQLTAAYNRIAALEEQLLACRIQS